MKRCSVLMLFVFFILIIGCKVKETAVSSAVPNERFNSIKKIINEKISKVEIPSVSVALAENGKIIWMESFGWADKENKIKATPTTLYSIASISKPLTATGIMKLHEQGKLNLDEDIQTYMGTLNMKSYLWIVNALQLLL
jgi:CubicO group peptidase (beta-lactamase class C family)